MAKKQNSFTGRWHITEMEMWGPDARNLLGPAFIEFKPDNTGSFRFSAVQAHLDCRLIERDGFPVVEFSWEGDDDGDHNCGRGWAVLKDRIRIEGRIFIHMGDESSFEAKRESC
jgi:hypothetical protein